MGLAWPARRPSDQNLRWEPGQAIAARRECPARSSWGSQAAADSGGETQGRGHNGRATHPADQGLPGATPAIAPVARPSRVEAASLEIDWSQIVPPLHGRGFRRMGRAGPRAAPACLRALLPLYRQPHRRRGPDPGRLPEDLLESGQLRHGARQPAGVDHHHDPQPAGGQLPADPQPARNFFIG